jgi:hypothetical protein
MQRLQLHPYKKMFRCARTDYPHISLTLKLNAFEAF